jgi:hypothetical protein
MTSSLLMGIFLLRTNGDSGGGNLNERRVEWNAKNDLQTEGRRQNVKDAAGIELSIAELKAGSRSTWKDCGKGDESAV